MVNCSANKPPETVGTIAAQELTEGGSPVEVDVSGAFRDPDGDDLSYTAESSDDQVATASASGSTVSLRPVSTGSATVTVTAKDPGGLTATQTIDIRVIGGGQPSGPDLIVEDFTLNKRTARLGEDVNFSYNIRNQGDSASSATRTRLYASVNPTISRGDTEIRSLEVPSIDASEVIEVTGTFRINNPAGTFYFGACLDNRSSETDTDNNCSSGVALTLTRGGGGDTYTAGQEVPNWPSGFFIPAQLTGGSFSWSGGRAKVTFRNAGFMRLQSGTTYTCEASGRMRDRRRDRQLWYD